MMRDPRYSMRRMHLHNVVRILPIAIVLALAACGWRLQGTARLPEVLATAYVDAKDPYTDFHRALRESLIASGANIVEDRALATAIVRIRSDVSGQRVLSVSARNTPQEFQVYYVVEYSVESAGRELIAPDTIQMTRDYSYDETAVLAKQREQAVLREALARDLAGMVVRRLAAL